jgi:hypothetical protein
LILIQNGSFSPDEFTDKLNNIFFEKANFFEKAGVKECCPTSGLPKFLLYLPARKQNNEKAPSFTVGRMVVLSLFLQQG